MTVRTVVATLLTCAKCGWVTDSHSEVGRAMRSTASPGLMTGTCIECDERARKDKRRVKPAIFHAKSITKTIEVPDP